MASPVALADPVGCPAGPVAVPALPVAPACRRAALAALVSPAPVVLVAVPAA
ncbi:MULTISPECIES: hypothetical protein [Amycolatopsis]|uniref:hypothetical protein n=1 Tax=Amycolatopsis TaxID=1813 RepID=UPI00174E0BDE|nr:hypothetical protein [Amycolatopsis bullii]